VTTAEISAAVSAVTTAVVGTALNWGSRLTAWLRSTVPDDHRALLASARPLTSAESTTGQLRVLVAAPSRRLRRDGLDPDAVTTMVARHLDRAFGAPDYSSLTEVRYTIRSGDPGQTFLRQLHLSRGGAVALDWSVEQAPVADDDTVGLPLLEFLRPLLTLLLLLRGPAYDEVYRRRRLRFRRRCDWFIAVAASVIDDSGRSRYWVPVFPGRSARRAAEQRPSAPVGGISLPELRGWPSRRPWDAFVRAALRGLLHENGYHDVGGAIEDAVAAAHSGLVPQVEAQMRLSFQR
jgi:hypothetical protein